MRMHKHITCKTPSSQKLPKKQGTQKSMPCQYFNQNSCVYCSSHETKGIAYKHICSFCVSQLGKSFPHIEKESRNKKKCKKRIDLCRAHPPACYADRYVLVKNLAQGNSCRIPS